MRKPTADGWYSMLAILGMGVTTSSRPFVRKSPTSGIGWPRLEGPFDGYIARLDRCSPP